MADPSVRGPPWIGLSLLFRYTLVSPKVDDIKGKDFAPFTNVIFEFIGENLRTPVRGRVMPQIVVSCKVTI